MNANEENECEDLNVYLRYKRDFDGIVRFLLGSNYKLLTDAGGVHVFENEIARVEIKNPAELGLNVWFIGLETEESRTLVFDGKHMDAWKEEYLE